MLNYLNVYSFTFGLVHVVEHPGPSFVQHILQKHHLTRPGLHALHQAEGHMPTPDNTTTPKYEFRFKAVEMLYKIQ